MTAKHDSKGRVKRVGEPAQVYLTDADRERLERLMTQLGTTKSDVLRRGLEALELQHAEPASHPALRIIGLVVDGEEPSTADFAREHDATLATSEERSWPTPTSGV